MDNFNFYLGHIFTFNLLLSVTNIDPYIIYIIYEYFINEIFDKSMRLPLVNINPVLGGSLFSKNKKQSILFLPKKTSINLSYFKYYKLIVIVDLSYCANSTTLLPSMGFELRNAILNPFKKYFNKCIHINCLYNNIKINILSAFNLDTYKKFINNKSCLCFTDCCGTDICNYLITYDSIKYDNFCVCTNCASIKPYTYNIKTSFKKVVNSDSEYCSCMMCQFGEDISDYEVDNYGYETEEIEDLEREERKEFEKTHPGWDYDDHLACGFYPSY